LFHAARDQLRHLPSRTMLAVIEHENFIIVDHELIIGKLPGYAEEF
jgi:hypothetical protein